MKFFGPYVLVNTTMATSRASKPDLPKLVTVLSENETGDTNILDGDFKRLMLLTVWTARYLPAVECFW